MVQNLWNRGSLKLFQSVFGSEPKQIKMGEVGGRERDFGNDRENTFPGFEFNRAPVIPGGKENCFGI